VLTSSNCLSDCFLWIEAEVISHNKFQLSAGEPPQLSGAPAGSLDFIKVWISRQILNLGFVSKDKGDKYVSGWYRVGTYFQNTWPFINRDDQDLRRAFSRHDKGSDGKGESFFR